MCITHGLPSSFCIKSEKVRKSSSRTYLKDPRIQFAELDFAHPGRLTEQLAVHKQLHGGWDYIIHCAGVTKCRHKDEFDKGNYVYTRNFVEALRTLDMVPRQFVYISSLSIFGPIHEDNYAPISERDTAMPNTAYGVSKLKSEHYLQSLNDFPTVIFRPTGVYGPRERDYFLMAFLAYWYPDTFEFNRLFPNLDNFFASAEQFLFRCQPSVEFSEHFPSMWFSEPFNMGYFAYYPMIGIVTIYYFLFRFEWFEKVSFVLVTSFFIYYLIYILVPVAGPQFYFCFIH